MKESVKIPLERVAVIVGPNGEVKEFIEGKSATSLNIDSQTGEVEIDTKDSIKGIRAKKLLALFQTVYINSLRERQVS